MEVTRLILVLQVLGSAWSNAAQQYHTRAGLGFTPWLSLYASSQYHPRFIQRNVHVDIVPTSHRDGSFRSSKGHGFILLKDVTPTPAPLKEKQIISALMRYGQHHKYVLKTVLRGLKLLRDSDISDIRQCVREALSAPSERQAQLSHHALQSTSNEETYIVKALLTEPNYMEFCVQRAARKTMSKQKFETIATDMSSILKGRQMKQLGIPPTTLSSVALADETQAATESASLGSVDEIEPTTTSSPTTEVISQGSNTSSVTAVPLEDTNSSETSLVPVEETTQLTSSGLNASDLAEAADINTALSIGLLTSGAYNQITQSHQKMYPTAVPGSTQQKSPPIYHHGNIYIAPGINSVPRPYLSIFTVGEVDPEVTAAKSVPASPPELYWGHFTTEEVPSTTTTEKSSLDNTVRHLKAEDSTLQVPEVVSQEDTPPSVKKMLVDDDFMWPGPFAMEHHHVKRSSSLSSPMKFSLDVLGKQTPEEDHSAEDSDMMKSEAIPVISVHGEIPELGKEINVIKEFAETASTAEPPIVLKVQRVPTHVDTSEFWNTGKEDHSQESSAAESNAQSTSAFLDEHTTENTEIRESRTLEVATDGDETMQPSDTEVPVTVKEVEATNTQDELTHQTTSVTERSLEVVTDISGENKLPITGVLFDEDSGDSSEESASNESKSSSEEDGTKVQVIQTVSEEDSSSIEDVNQTIAASYTTEAWMQADTEVESSTVTEGNLSDGSERTTEAPLESSTSTIVDVTTVQLVSATGEAVLSNDGSISDVTEETAEASILTTVDASTEMKTSGATEATTLNQDTFAITEPTIYATNEIFSQISEASTTHESTSWDPDFDFVVEEFSSSHIAKDDIPDEYMDYSLSLLGELAKTVSQLRARAKMLKARGATSNQKMNESHSGAKDASPDGSQYLQPANTVTSHPIAEHKDDVKLLTSQDEIKNNASLRSKRQVQQRELPNAILKLLKDKGLDTKAMINRRGSSASANQIPMSPEKFSKSRTQKILFSLSDKRKKTVEDDEENETDSGTSAGKDGASIMELIDVNRVHHLLADKHAA